MIFLHTPLVKIGSIMYLKYMKIMLLDSMNNKISYKTMSSYKKLSKSSQPRELYLLTSDPYTPLHEQTVIILTFYVRIHNTK